MKIGIIETGEVNEKIIDKHGAYSGMYSGLLAAADPTLEFFTLSVVKGEQLGAPTDADGWIVTGSRHGVYDDLPWIGPLKDFLRLCLKEKVPVVGVCFGHQILAEAMGGKVVKSEKGWGLGVHEYVVTNLPGWMKGLGGAFTSHALHQDQIITQPPETTVLAESDFCKYAALAYGDAEAPLAISVQPHPEFSADYVNDVIDARLAGVVPAEVIDPARKGLGAPVNNADWGQTMVRFFRDAAARRV